MHLSDSGISNATKRFLGALRGKGELNFKDSLHILKTLNITRVNLGLDSGDDTMLEFLRKGNTDKSGKFRSASQINYEAVRRLANSEISIHASFPLGILGETKESLNNTIQFIERIVQDFPHFIATLEASELLPLPNSPLWNLLVSDKENSTFDGGIDSFLIKTGVCLTKDIKAQLKKKYLEEDLLDVQELAKDWIDHFTKISYNDINESSCILGYSSKCTFLFNTTS